PPPWPPIASTAMASGLVVSSATLAGSAFILREDRHALRAPRLEPADHGGADARGESLERARIVHDLGAVERRAQHGGFRHLAAIAAADARVVDGCDRIVLQGVAGALDRERRAARQPNTGVV